MNTLIDDFYQPKMKYPTPRASYNKLQSVTIKDNVVKQKHSRFKKYYKQIKNGTSIKRLVILIISVIVISGPILFMVVNGSSADTGTQTIYPNADYGTTNNFAQTGGTPTSGNHCASGQHCDRVDYN